MFTQSNVHTAGDSDYDAFIRRQTLLYPDAQCDQFVSNNNTNRAVGRHCLVKELCNAMTCSSYDTDRNGSVIHTNRTARL